MEDLRRKEVREIAHLTARLSPAQMMFFQAEYGRHRRNPTTALVLCILLGGFGAHYFYFGRHRGGVVRLLLCWTIVPFILAQFEARTITARALRYNASLANELVLALQGAVEEQPGQVPSVVEAGVRTAATSRPREPIGIAADGAESALIAAAWAGRQAEAEDGAEAPLTLEQLAPYASAPAPTVDSDWELYAPRPAANHMASNGWEPPQQAPFEAGYQLWRRQDEESVAPVAPDLPAAEAPSEHEALPTAAANGGAEEPEPEPVPWFLADARPAVAAAAATAAAEWTDVPTGEQASEPPTWSWDEQPTPAPAVPAESEVAAEATREPVFMYQVAPATRHEPVRYGPPVVPEPATERSQVPSAPATKRAGGLSEEAGLAAMLATGLAELLRERTSGPRTRPLSRPVVAPPADMWARTNPQVEPPASRARAPERAELASPAAGVETPVRGRRRRTVHRVIVRKLAVLDGQVLAESSVERQVPVVLDDDEMDRRVLAATDDAARAALEDLSERVPAEALPAIRAQLAELESGPVEPAAAGAW